MGVHSALATAEKRKWWILNPWAYRVENFFAKYGHAVYHWKALEELNNFERMYRSFKTKEVGINVSVNEQSKG